VIAETMQMLDSKGDNQGGGYNAPSNAPTENANQGGGYNAPAQGQGQSYQQPQQQSYQKPAQQSYNNNQAAPQQQNRKMPEPDTMPSYDINEDEIPF